MTEAKKDLTHDEEWLLLGFREAAEKRSKKPLLDRFLNWIRKDAESLLTDRKQNPEIVKIQTKDSFREFLFQYYFCPILSLKEPNPNWTQIGKRVDAHAVTVQDWIEGNRDPKLSTISMVYAAQDAQFRNGHAVAADAYIVAFDFLCRLIDRPTSVTQPLGELDICQEHDNDPTMDSWLSAELREEALILYNLFRTPEFWSALEDDDEQALHSAARLIAAKVESFYPCTNQWDLKAIRDTLKRRAYEWSVMEAALPYEWF